VTDDGRQFVAVKNFTVFEGTEKNPGKTLVVIKAMEQDINGVLM